MAYTWCLLALQFTTIASGNHNEIKSINNEIKSTTNLYLLTDHIFTLTQLWLILSQAHTGLSLHLLWSLYLPLRV